jgi:hypothetical protein
MPKYKEGDQVWLEGKNLRISQPTAKLAPRRHGPFKVIKVLSPVSYQLALPMQWSIHPVFHIDLLTPYCETITHGPNYQRPLLDLVDGEEEYSVEKILDSRKFGRRWCLQYLVKWEGYPDSDNMWVDKDDVFADDKVWEFKTSNPDKETHIRSLSFAKSPHPSALIHSHLLQQHTRRYMSSNGSDLAQEYTAGVYADSASGDEQPVIRHIHNLLIDTANTCTQAITATLRAEAAVFSPRPHTLSMEAAEVAEAFRTLSIHTPAPLSPTLATNDAIEEGHYEVSMPKQNIVGYEDSTGMASGAAAPRQEVLGSEELAIGHILSIPPTLISHLVHNAENPETTAMSTTHQSPSPSQLSLSTSPNLFAPSAWRHLASTVRKPKRWQVDLPLPSDKVVKIPLQFCRPTPSKSTLPKGWVYAVEDAKEGVKVELTDPSLYNSVDQTLTHTQHQCIRAQQSDPYRCHCRATNTTTGLLMSPSISSTSTGWKHQPDMSRYTSKS